VVASRGETQADSAVARRQGMSNVAGKRAGIAYLGPTDDAATFGQAGTVAIDAFVTDDLCMRYTTTDHNVVLVVADGVEAGDSGGIHDGFDRLAETPPCFHKNVGAAANNAGTTIVAAQQFERLRNRFRFVVATPAQIAGARSAQ